MDIKLNSISEEKCMVLTPFLKLLRQGAVFKNVVAFGLMLIAALVLLAEVIVWFWGWKQVFTYSGTGALLLILILLMLLAMVAALASFNIVIFNANRISKLPESKDYVVIPIFVILIKMLGEVRAVFFTFLGIALFFFSLSADGSFFVSMISPIDLPGGFVMGILSLFVLLLIGFADLLFSYFIAEQVGVFADIARNTKCDCIKDEDVSKSNLESPVEKLNEDSGEVAEGSVNI